MALGAPSRVAVRLDASTRPFLRRPESGQMGLLENSARHAWLESVTHRLDLAHRSPLVGQHIHIRLHALLEVIGPVSAGLCLLGFCGRGIGGATVSGSRGGFRAPVFSLSVRRDDAGLGDEFGGFMQLRLTPGLVCRVLAELLFYRR